MVKNCKPILQDPDQIIPEVTQKQLIVPASQQSQKIAVILSDMAEQMQKHILPILAAEQSGVPILKDMVKQFPAQFFQQKLSGLKVGIESRPAHIGPVNDISHGDPAVIPLREKLDKCLKNSASGLFLPSVHSKPPYIFTKMFHI